MCELNHAQYNFIAWRLIGVLNKIDGTVPLANRLIIILACQEYILGSYKNLYKSMYWIFGGFTSLTGTCMRIQMRGSS